MSFVVPVRNGVAWIQATLESIAAQATDGLQTEIVVVDDRSDDGSSELLRELACRRPIRIVEGTGRGAAAALNTGIRAAMFPIVCQVDQDVEVRPGWLRALMAHFEDPAVAAVQGCYQTDPRAGVCARVMGLDLEQRYAAIGGLDTDHVCTGNAAYRVDAVRAVGGFDESLGYGYDNDLSYRLRGAGHRLVFCREARSLHHWREGLGGYLRQQYGFGYGRLDLVAKHPRRIRGDRVSPLSMMLHPLVAALTLGAFAVAAVAAAVGRSAVPFALAGALLAGALLVERAVAGIRAARRFGCWTPLVFPALHAGRDLAWVAAMAAWSARRLGGRAAKPEHSMSRRRREKAAPGVARLVKPAGPPTRVLALIPAYNEAANLPAVVADVRRCHPALDVLVVDDGSTDGTALLLDDLDVRWMRFPERLGVGSAVRAGLRYAARIGFDAVVRMDGDGQHGADDVDRLLAPLRNGSADVVLGSRYATQAVRPSGIAPLAVRVLAACLSAVTRRRVTDPTSGFYAVGPRAIRLLAEHHPTGYPEPELRLFLSRNGLRTVEVPVRARARMAGRTSLTAGRLAAAGARVALALLIVPLRSPVKGPAGD